MEFNGKRIHMVQKLTNVSLETIQSKISWPDGMTHVALYPKGQREPFFAVIEHGKLDITKGFLHNNQPYEGVRCLYMSTTNTVVTRYMPQATYDIEYGAKEGMVALVYHDPKEDSFITSTLFNSVGVMMVLSFFGAAVWHYDISV